jgi:uncharacterized protein
MFKKLFLISLLLPLMLFAYSSPGKPVGFVNDFAGVLNSNEKASLEAKLVTFEKDTSNEISVGIINSLDGDTIENYAVDLFKEWGVGKKKNDNGVLLLFAMKDRKMRIEVGYGLEGALTDLQSESIISNDLSPAFKAGDYYYGISRAVDNIILATKGEYAPQSVPLGLGNINWPLVFYVFFFGMIYLAAILGRSKSWWMGGVLGGLAAFFATLLFGFMLTGLLSFIVFIPLGLLFDFIVSRAYEKGKITGNYPWWIGGVGGGWGGGGGGFGGFGGGGSGGGGRSGGW